MVSYHYPQMEILCKCLGGSHSYGLNTASSDIDIRGVFLNTDYKHILGIKSEDHVKEKEGDEILFELRRFVDLLRNGNTGALEILFNKNWTQVDSTFVTCFTNRAERFVDSEKLHKCLKGYAQHELRLAMGLRPGEIGHKRYEMVKQYGFSPKNFTQLFRLMMVGEHFFKTGEFIVDCRTFPEPSAHAFLMDVKTEPTKYTVDYLRKLHTEFEHKMDEAFAARTQTFKFDHEYASSLILEFYYPSLSTAYDTLSFK